MGVVHVSHSLTSLKKTLKLIKRGPDPVGLPSQFQHMKQRHPLGREERKKKTRIERKTTQRVGGKERVRYGNRRKERKEHVDIPIKVKSKSLLISLIFLLF